MKQFSVILAVAIMLAYSANDPVLARYQHQGNGDEPQSKTDSTSRHTTDPKVRKTIDAIVDSYLKLNNSLVTDKSKKAAEAGKELVGAIETMDTSLLTSDKRKLYAIFEEDAKEHAQHISDRAGNIEHQRKHFDALSKNVYELVKTFGAGRALYKTFCPMYSDNKGAMWLSESKSIRNPYYGKKMLTCGSVQETIK